MSKEKNKRALPSRPFYMIRHGRAESNDAHILDSGKVNAALTEKGVKQAKTIAPHLSKLTLQPTRIFHSPLKRTADTATLINTMIQLPMTVQDNLREQAFGQWEDIKYWKLTLSRIFRSVVTVSSDMNPPGGEQYDDFRDRIYGALEQILSQSANDVPLLVAHAGTIEAAASVLGLGKYAKKAENCELYLFEPDTKNPDVPWKISVFKLKEGALVQSCASFCPEKVLPPPPNLSQG